MSLFYFYGLFIYLFIFNQHFLCIQSLSGIDLPNELDHRDETVQKTHYLDMFENIFG